MWEGVVYAMTEEDFYCSKCKEYFEVEDFDDINEPLFVTCPRCETNWRLDSDWTYDGGNKYFYLVGEWTPPKPMKKVFCPRCHGKGELAKITKTKILFHSVYPKGKIMKKRNFYKCPTCNGTGKIEVVDD